MKVLFVEPFDFTGHHKNYLLSLLQIKEIEKIVVICDKNNSVDLTSFYQCKSPKDGLFNYFIFFKEFYKIVKKEKPDIIHFVYGDFLYKFFGICLRRLKKQSHIIITLHQIRHSLLRDLSHRIIAKYSDFIVVHTTYLKRNLEYEKIKNVKHIEYPYFNSIGIVEKNKARKELGIGVIKEKLLLCLGGTRHDKGLDILLSALQGFSSPFHLLIAGKEEYFSSFFIEEKAKTFSEKTTLVLKFLDDRTFGLCLNAADIIVLPYRKSFEGASGPLADGVALGKMIIGPSHGSIGSIIKENHLGFVFESENSESLRKCLEIALLNEWKIDDKYTAYQTELKPIVFNEKYLELYKCVFKKGFKCHV